MLSLTSTPFPHLFPTSLTSFSFAPASWPSLGILSGSGWACFPFILAVFPYECEVSGMLQVQLGLCTNIMNRWLWECLFPGTQTPLWSSFLGTLSIAAGLFLENSISRELKAWPFLWSGASLRSSYHSAPKSWSLDSKSSVGGNHLSSSEKLHFYWDMSARLFEPTEPLLPWIWDTGLLLVWTVIHVAYVEVTQGILLKELCLLIFVLNDGHILKRNK